MTKTHGMLKRLEFTSREMAVGMVLHSTEPFGSVFIGDLMTEQETSQWSEIVRYALQKYYDLKSHGQPCAVPGAPLKPLVLQLAAEKVEYPPPEFQNKNSVIF